MVAERVASEKVDVPPSDWGDLPQQLNRFLVTGDLIAFQQLREQDRIVGNDDIGDQPGALVADRHIEIGSAGQLLSSADLGNRRPQLMIGLEPVLRAMDISLQLRIAVVFEGVDAAHQLVELEDRLSRRVMLRQGAQFANQPILTGFLEPKSGDDPVYTGVVGDDRLAVDLSGGLKKVGAFPRGDMSRNIDAELALAGW